MSTIMSCIEKIDAITGGFHPGELLCSANPVGRSRMDQAIKHAKKYWEDKKHVSNCDTPS